MKKLSLIYLPTLFFLYITIETILKLNHSSLCHSTGCLLADNLLKFDSLYLNYIGIAISIVIAIIGWLSYKKSIDEKVFYLILFASLTFETIMLGYQYFVSPEMCVFCMGIYAFLFVMLLSSSWRYFLVALFILPSSIIALSFLAIPKSEAFVLKNGNYLIQSPTCEHCKKVKLYLKENSISFTKLAIDDIEARNFVTFLNFSSIPILIVKDGKNVKIVNGDSDIIKFFSEKETENKVVFEESVSVAGEDSNLLYEEEDKEEGCGFATLSKIDESNCSKQ